MFSKLWDQFCSVISPCVLCLTMNNTASVLCEQCIGNLPFVKRACIGCGLPLSDLKIGDRCGPCLIMSLPYDKVKCLFEYQWPCNQFITQIKFKKKLEFVNLLADLMASRFNTHADDRPTCLIPVPLHRDRLKERGFNQAYVLAKRIGQKLNIPVAWDQVKKCKQTRVQSSLSLEQRVANLKDAFEVHASFPPSFKFKVAIIDDVMTSGETVAALTKVLKAAGVSQVEIWCCCRTLKPNKSVASPLVSRLLSKHDCDAYL